VPFAFTRAKTDDEKKFVINQLLQTWLKNPQQRLGQLIYNATAEGPYPECHTNFHQVLFYIEDNRLVTKVASFPTEES